VAPTLAIGDGIARSGINSVSSAALARVGDMVSAGPETALR
jgi:hypothetical protein